MLFKGKQDGIYLYEVTTADLVFQGQATFLYAPGNILLFANKKQVELGLELVKASDLASAYEYLAGEFAQGADSPLCAEESTLLREQVLCLENQLTLCEARLTEREGLLCEVNGDLESQRYSNQLLIVQLETLRSQIVAEQKTREEVLDDLVLASEETFRIDQELQETKDALQLLEHELADRICELIELDAARADLQERLEQGTPLPPAAPQPSAGSPQSPAAPQPSAGSPQSPAAPLPSVTSLRYDEASALPQLHQPESRGQTITLASGKQIQIYHDFTLEHAQRKRRRGKGAVWALKAVLFCCVAVVLVLAGSVLATAGLNSISLGEALDTILKLISPLR